MKRLVLGLSIIVTSFVLFSCEDDGGDLTITVNNGNSNPTAGTELTGFVLDGQTMTLDASIAYILTGPLIVNEGATLQIPAGTTITASGGADSYIAVRQGGKIEALGSATSPIKFTASTTEPGAWGGLIVLGKAPINSGDTATSEIGGFTYGGDQATDDSGTIQYVVIEYSGAEVTAGSENNGFSFYGVGSGTTISHIQSYFGSDDGVEFFGGTVNASNIILIGNEDDSLDWTEGFTGTLTDVYIRHEGDLYDKAIEADGFNTDTGVGVSLVFYSNPTLNNVTVVGKGSATTVQNGDNIDAGKYEALRIREATQATFNNLVIEGFGRGIRLAGTEAGLGADANVGDHANNDLLNFTANFTDVTTQVVNDSGVDFTESDMLTIDASSTETNVNSWGASWATGL